MSFAQQKELDKDPRQDIIVNPVSKLFTVFQAYAILIFAFDQSLQCQILVNYFSMKLFVYIVG